VLQGTRLHVAVGGASALSGRIAGPFPLVEDFKALGPAILLLGERSHRKSQLVREKMGEAIYLDETCRAKLLGNPPCDPLYGFATTSPGSHRQLLDSMTALHTWSSV
jgi:hypothetical protein